MENQPRLVFFAPNIIGGVKTYILNLQAFLKSINYPSTVILYDSCDSILTKDKYNNDIINISFSKYSSAKSRYELIKSLILPNDILICSDSFEIEAIKFIECDNKTIFILHGDLNHYQSILKNHYTFFDRILTVSQGLKEKYSALYTNAKFSVCHPLVHDFNNFIIHNTSDTLNCVYIGRLEYLKGGDDLVQTILYFSKKDLLINWTLFITTEGSDSNLISKLPPDSNVFYDKPNEDILNELSKNEILLFPSRSEGFGIAVLEAMKRGLVPIVRDIEIGIPDMVKQGESGIVISNYGEIIENVEDLYFNREKLKELQKRAYEYSNSRFKFNNLGTNFIDKTRKDKYKIKNYSKIKLSLIELIIPEFLLRIGRKFKYILINN